ISALRAAVDRPNVPIGMVDRVEAGARSEQPAVEDFAALGLFAFARRRMVEHFDVDAHFGRFFRRALRAAARDHLKRAHARRTADRQSVVGGVAGDLVEPADDGALRGGWPGSGAEEHESCEKSADHGALSWLVAFPCPCAKLANSVSRSTEP